MKLLLVIATCGFPPLGDGNDLRHVNGNFQRFMRSEKIIVVFTEHGKIIGRLQTKVIERLSNGDLKIYGEIVSKVGQNTRKYTLAGIIHPADIEAGGIVRADNLIHATITNRTLKNTQEQQTAPRTSNSNPSGTVCGAEVTDILDGSQVR